MHFQYTILGPLDEFRGFIQICYFECPHICGIYLESLLTFHLHILSEYLTKSHQFWSVVCENAQISG